MSNARKRSGYTRKDLREVSENPRLKKADIAKVQPFSEVFPDLSASIRRSRSSGGAKRNPG
jgi:hypothetical protein